MLAEIFGVDGIVLLVIVLVLLFGGAAIPKLARSLGSAQTEFKKGLAEGQKAEATDAGAAASTENGTSAASDAAKADNTKPTNPS
jgi:sec-independent protein translocase protein TatA